MNLIPEQMVVINAIRAGNSVFFTGSAGTGKSYLLKRLITMLPPQSTFITASTGAAACHIGGTTLHVCARVCVCVCVCGMRVTCCKYRVDSVAVSYISANTCDSSVALRFSITSV